MTRTLARWLLAIVALCCLEGGAWAQATRYEFPAIAYKEINYVRDAPSPDAACAQFAAIWGYDQNDYSMTLLPMLPGEWKCQRSYKGVPEPDVTTFILGQCQTAAAVPMGSPLLGSYYDYPSWDINKGVCYCSAGYVFNSGVQWCMPPPPATYQISLTGPSRTKALVAGPAIVQVAEVTRSGIPAGGVGVTVRMGSGGSMSGTTDASGRFVFTYVPPYRQTVDHLTASCGSCSNQAQKDITVDACDVCEFGVGNPIQPATGEKLQTEVDWHDDGVDPLTLTRSYRSYATPSARMGNWSHPWAAQVKEEPQVAVVSLGDGRKVIFRRVSSAYAWVGEGSADVLLDTAGGPQYRQSADDSTWQFDAAGRLQTITGRSGRTLRVGYDAQGRVITVTNGFGKTMGLGYDASGRLALASTPDGSHVGWGYDNLSRLVSVSYPDGTGKNYLYEDTQWPNALTGIVDEMGQRSATFSYDAAGRAVSTQHAGAQAYTVGYTQGGAATGRLAVGSTVDAGVYRTTAQVSDPLGANRAYEWVGGNGTVRLAGGSAGGGLSDFASRNLDASNLPQSETDFMGVTKAYTWDSQRRLKVATTEAVGQPESRTTGIQWHPLWHLPLLVTEPGRQTASTYDERGNLLSAAVTDTATGETRTRRWSYTAAGLPETMRDARGNIWRYGYDDAGNRTTVTDPLGQTTRFAFDAGGRITSQTDPNGLVKTTTYDMRGRAVEVSRAGERSQFAYTTTGLLSSASLPNGLQLTYGYDAAQRLVTVTDNRGSTILYTLDAMGNRVREEVKDANGNLVWTMGRVMDTLNRVASTHDALGRATLYTHDANGEPVTTTDALNQTTRQSWDALRRPTGTTLPDNAATAYGWNALDGITQVKDPKGVSTQYERNAFGEARSETSPDIGSIRWQRDANGHVLSETDAKGVIATIERDALGRPVRISYPDQVQVFTYDASGDVSQITDNSGSTSYERDLQGRVLTKTQLVNYSDPPGAFKVGYGWRNGDLDSIVYPSGLQVFYRRSAGRVTHADVQPPPHPSDKTRAQALFVADLVYTPLGRPKSWRWANGDTAARSFDANGHMTASEISSYSYDAMGRITSLTQNLWAEKTVGTSKVRYQVPVMWTAGYDMRGRLNLFSRPGASSTYSYDANGNRQTGLETTTGDLDLEGTFDSPDQAQSNAQAIKIEAASNRLLGVSQTVTSSNAGATVSSVSTEVNYTLDANGAMTSDALRTFEYDAARRMSKVKAFQKGEAAGVEYLRNAMNQRVFKSELTPEQLPQGQDRLDQGFIDWLKQTLGWFFNNGNGPGAKSMLGVSFVYGEDGAMLGEYDNGTANNSGRTEFIWLPSESGGYPTLVGLYRNGKLYQVHSDHLGTPRLVTDGANAPVWQWPYSAFGNNRPVGVLQAGTTSTGQVVLKGTKPVVEVSNRLPGQVFDGETGLFQNWNREYNARIGRYIQSDPIGLNGGINRIAYVKGSPLSKTDPTGLFTSDVHFKMTLDALRICKSMSLMDKLRLAYAAAAADWTPSWDESQAVANAHWHDMSELSTMGLDGLAKSMAADFVRDQMSTGTTEGIGRAIHTWQDAAARGHRGQQRYSGHFDLGHFLGDLLPTDGERMLGIINTRSLLRQLPQCGCDQ